MCSLIFRIFGAVILGSVSLLTAAAGDKPATNPLTISAQEKPTTTRSRIENPSYVLGAGDGLTIWVLGADEISAKPYVVLPDGYLDVPLVGRILAAGKSVENLKQELRNALNQYFRDPQVSVAVTDSRSQPVSILGSVNQPGIHQLEGGKSLLEVLSLAQGTAPDADSTVVVTRRVEQGPIPVAGSTRDPSGKFYIAKIDLQAVAQGKSPENNIRIYPNDVIQVPKARMIYVLGEVLKPGGYVLHQDENVTALQALSMAGGATPYGATQSARLLRVTEGSTNRAETKVDLRRILQGKGSADALMRPEDILYVPGNMSKKAGVAALENAIHIGTGMLIWR